MTILYDKDSLQKHIINLPHWQQEAFCSFKLKMTDKINLFLVSRLNTALQRITSGTDSLMILEIRILARTLLHYLKNILNVLEIQVNMPHLLFYSYTNRFNERNYS